MRFWWQSFLKPKRNPEKDLSALVEALKAALKDHLKSVIVFGSLARGDFDAQRSDVNVLVIADLPFETLEAMGPAFKSWLAKGHRPPVLVAPDDLDDFARDFPIEFLDMQDRHKVLYGANPLSALKVNMKHLEAQCEHDLALIQLKLRQALAASCEDPKKIRLALIESVPSVLTLLHTALRLEEDPAKLDKIQAAERLAGRLQLDAKVLRRVHETRLRRQADNVEDVACHYLDLITGVLNHLRKR